MAALALVLIFSTVLMCIFHNRFWAPADEGNYAHVAERLWSGQVLHRDVQDVHAGYINFVNAAAFSIFGMRMVSMRYPLAALTILQSGLMFLLLRPRGITLGLIGALALTSLSFVQFLNPTANWYSLFLAISTIAWLTWIPRGNTARNIGTGVLVGLTFLFRQLSGVFLALGVLVFLLLEHREKSDSNRPYLARALIAVIALCLTVYSLRVTEPVGWVLFGVWPLPILLHAWRHSTISNRDLRRTLFSLSLGALTSALPLALYHLAHGSVHDWFGDMLGAAVSLPGLDFMKRPGYLMMGVLAWRGFHSREAASLLNATMWTGVLLLSAVLGMRLLHTMVRSYSPSGFHPLPVIAVFYALVSLHYQVPIYLFYTVGLTLSAVLLLTSARSAVSRILTCCVALFIGGVALYYQAGMPLTRQLEGIVAGQRRFPEARLPSSVAGIYVDSADASVYRQLIGLIERESEPGDTIFALPTNAELYFLGRRTNPFKFYNTALGIRSGADLDAVIHLIRCSPPKLVFYDSENKYNTPASAEIATFVATRFQRLAAVPPFQVFRRVTDSSSKISNEPGCGSSNSP